MEKPIGIIIILSIALIVGITVPTTIAASGSAKHQSDAETIAQLQSTENKLKTQLNQLRAEDSNLRTKLAMYEKSAPSTQTSGNQLGNLNQYYADHFIHLFDLQSKLYDSLGDGTIPGCNFKIKNVGNKTITDLEVTAYYIGKNGQVIGQEHYPVIGSFNDITNPDYVTLKPNYTYQPDSTNFWSAKSVNANDWDVGNVKIKITTLQLQ